MQLFTGLCGIRLFVGLIDLVVCNALLVVFGYMLCLSFVICGLTVGFGLTVVVLRFSDLRFGCCLFLG